MKLPLSLLLLPLFGTSAASSMEMRNDFIEAHYFQGEIEDEFLPADFDGWELRGSKSFGRWTVTASHEDRVAGPFLVDFFGLRADVTRTTTRVGGGYAFPVHPYLEVMPALGVVRATVDADFTGFCEVCDLADPPSENDTGYFVALGLRTLLWERVELEFNHRFTNVMSDRVNDWRLDARYTFTPAWAVSVEYRDFEGDRAVGAAVRWYF